VPLPSRLALCHASVSLAKQSDHCNLSLVQRPCSSPALRTAPWRMPSLGIGSLPNSPLLTSEQNNKPTVPSREQLVSSCQA